MEVLAESYALRAGIADILGSMVLTGDNTSLIERPEGHISLDPVTQFIRMLVPEDYLDQYHDQQSAEQIADPILLDTRIAEAPHFIRQLQNDVVITVGDAEDALYRLGELLGIDLLDEPLVA